jgi:alanine racemase
MSLQALIRLDALRENLPGRLRADTVLDVRADAWGHGAVTVAALSGDAALICDPQDRDALRDAGIAPSRIGTDRPATVDPRAVYGLDGDLTPVMRLRGTVLSTKRLLRGEGVSYGYLYRAPQDTRVALVTGGYAQGVVRALGNAVSLSVDGVRCPILGRVAMDVCVVDIADHDIRRGADAWFFGDPAEGHPGIAEWTAATGMDAAELVAAVGVHADRVAA